MADQPITYQMSTGDLGIVFFTGEGGAIRADKLTTYAAGHQPSPRELHLLRAALAIAQDELAAVEARHG